MLTDSYARFETNKIDNMGWRLNEWLEAQGMGWRRKEWAAGSGNGLEAQRMSWRLKEWVGGSRVPLWAWGHSNHAIRQLLGSIGEHWLRQEPVNQHIRQ